jgi:hypothetical protein
MRYFTEAAGDFIKYFFLSFQLAATLNLIKKSEKKSLLKLIIFILNITFFETVRNAFRKRDQVGRIFHIFKIFAFLTDL